MKYLATLLIFLASFTGVQAQECYVDETDYLKQIVCFDDNLRAPLDSLGIKWLYPERQDYYEAITLTIMKDTMAVALTVFREEVFIEYVPHEVSHVGEFLQLDRELRAQFIGLQSTLIINLILSKGIPLYTIMDGERVYFN